MLIRCGGRPPPVSAERHSGAGGRSDDMRYDPATEVTMRDFGQRPPSSVNPWMLGPSDTAERDPARSVAVVVANGITPFELGVACEVFGLDRPELGVPWYQFRVCAAEPPPLRVVTGFLLDTQY